MAHVNWITVLPATIREISLVTEALINFTRIYYTHLMALFRDCPDEPVPEKLNQCGFYWSKRQWVAEASGGPYASLHLTPHR